MRKAVLLALLPIASYSALASDSVFVGGGYYTGNQFIAMNEYQRETVVASMATMLSASGLVGSKDNYQRKLSACLARVDPRQLSASLENYLRAKPEQWDASLGVPYVIMLDGFCEKRGFPLNRGAMFAR